MKKQTKGIIFTVIFGGGLLFWATAASLPNIFPPESDEQVTTTGTPADNFPDSSREQFCGTGSVKSNTYVREFKIPTECTMPLAIVADSQGNVWFAQTNTGNIAKFDPSSETFTEFENPVWPEGARSMMWGMDYAPDGTIWYTEDSFDSLWKFSIEDEQYQRLNYPTEEESLPQQLRLVGSEVIVNDFHGNKITFFEAAQSGDEITYFSLPSPVENSVSGGFAIDSYNNLWYTNWILNQGGVLVKFDQQGYEETQKDTNDSLPLFDFIDVFQLPLHLNTPNGLVVDTNGKIWIADTSSSFFFRFDPDTETFTRYITSTPPLSVYGNSTGLIKSPVSRPYWLDLDQNDRIVFNEQTANRIGVFDPTKETLVEYLIPSKNPNWSDCEQIDDCGLAQVFGFTIQDEKIWFTEWVENNIGVIDTSKQLPFDIELDKTEITMKKDDVATLTLKVTPLTSSDIPDVKTTFAHTAAPSDIEITDDTKQFQLDFDGPRIIKVTITTNQNAIANTYKVLIGAHTDDVTISKYITLIIES